MKITFCLFILFCTATAVGQVGAAVLSNQPQPLVIIDHPRHAEQHALASEQPLVGGGTNTYTYAQGERPLWEFDSDYQATPLGDVARAYRREKLATKKAQKVLEKQGS